MARPRVLNGVGALEQEAPTLAPPGVDMEAIKPRVLEAGMVDASREFADALATKLPELQFVDFHGKDHGSVLSAAVGRAVTFTLRKS